jgi:hypothetical protein
LGGLLLLALALVLGGCGESSDADEGSAPAVKTGDPATAFAPLVQLDDRERSYPVSADFFLRSAGLEFVGNSCPAIELDIAAGPISRPLVGQPVPVLDVHKLAHEPAYRSRALGVNCKYRSDSYTTTQRTRPYDRADRPAGLSVAEGFNLDILTDEQPGKRRLGRDGSLAGVPIYVHENSELIDGQPGVRLSYWMLFGRGEARDRATRDWIPHEGDWERVDVLALTHGKPKSRRYEPVAVEYRIGGDPHPVPWGDVETDQTGRHPVAYLARSNHTPFPRTAASDPGKRLSWKTWRDVRDVTREPWYGYGGGWGAYSLSEVASGPLGPTPFELETTKGVAVSGLGIQR